MILSSSACSAPRNHALDVNCDFINDTMDFSGSNNASESSLSPSVILQSPRPYRAPSYEFPMQSTTFQTDDDVTTAFDDVTTAFEAISTPSTVAMTTSRTNETSSSFCASTTGNSAAFPQHVATLATSANAVLPSPPTYPTRSFSVGASNMQPNSYHPVGSENPPRFVSFFRSSFLPTLPTSVQEDALLASGQSR